jgi:hypothetical protein
MNYNYMFEGFTTGKNEKEEVMLDSEINLTSEETEEEIPSPEDIINPAELALVPAIATAAKGVHFASGGAPHVRQNTAVIRAIQEFRGEATSEANVGDEEVHELAARVYSAI